MTGLAVFFALWLLLSWLCSLLWLGARQRLQHKIAALRPAMRAIVLRSLALLPLAIATGITAALFALPGLLIQAHCHPLQCGIAHAPAFTVSDTLWLVLLFIALPGIAAGWSTLRATRRVTRQWRHFSAACDGVRILDSAQPLACAVGFWRPTIYLSRGLIERLPSESVAAITAHERAHVARADNLWLAITRTSSLFWLRREQLIASIELAHDQCCDSVAAEAVGDALVVADTLVRCGRLQLAPAFSSNFLQGHIAARVTSVLDQRHELIAPVHILLTAGLLLLGIAAAAPALHVVLEYLQVL